MPPQAAQRGASRDKFVHPDAAHAKARFRNSAFAMEPIWAFYIFFAANLIAAIWNPIQDCDETFNYWEPTHYISHGYGLQTWEYSPDYSIRSWLYICLHALVGNIRRLLPQSTKLGEFYFIRYVLAFVCALCQTLLYRSISIVVNPRIGVFFVLALALSPGNFHASTAFLPSSFAMYMVMLGTASFINWTRGLKTAWGIFWFGVGGIIGWPFAAVLCAPFLLEEVILACVSDRQAIYETVWRVIRGVTAALIVLALDVIVNTFFYKKIEVVPWNIVKYNVFSNSGGPNLYGTEPWTFYFKNLALNFNIWFVLALLALPLFVLQRLAAPDARRFHSGIRTLVFVAPFYLWLGIFTSQPHKEERFMYPAYPFLALNAGISIHVLLSLVGYLDRRTVLGKVPPQFKLAVIAIFPLAVVFYLYFLRVVGIVSAYGAPLKIYEPLGAGIGPSEVGTVGGRGDSVCFGKEWYRFPTSYFLPRDMHAKFIRSEFRGLLPGEFSEAGTGFGFWSGTWLPTSGMNDRNEEDMGKYVSINQCTFLVDTQYPLNTEKGLALPKFEPDYVADTENWEVVRCKAFLDAGNTATIPRMLWVPSWWNVVPDKHQRKWGRHCLLKRKQSGVRIDDATEV